MNSIKSKAETKFLITRHFARSRLETEYLVKSYELIVPIFRTNCLKQRNLDKDTIGKTKPREQMGA